MIITDHRRQFYDLLIGKRVLILVHFDIDSLCASKILQHLFRTDHILYTVAPVQTKKDLVEAYRHHAELIKDIILINCGGCLDVLDFLQAAEGARFYIADNHRPFDVCNIYNDSQVKIISKLDEGDDVPTFDDVFCEESSDEEENNDDGVNRVSEEYLEKRRHRRLWEQRRQKILFDYTQFSSYGDSTAMLFYEMAWKMSKDCNDNLWWAIVGETHMFLTEAIEQDRYTLHTAWIQSHVSRLNHKAQDEKPLDSSKISFEKELQIYLYRHWTLVESLKHSPYTATNLKLWTFRGEKRMHEMLAEVGLPLVECRQNFCSMDVSLKKEVHELLESKSEKYGLLDLVFASFTITHGFRKKLSALDYVLATSAILESDFKDNLPTDCFLNASESLSFNKLIFLEKGIESSKSQHEAIYRQVKTFLNMNQIISAGPFLYATVLQGSPDAGIFSSPICLLRLTQFTLKAHAATSRSKKSKSLPLVLTTPDIRNPLQCGDEIADLVDSCLVCGIPPLCEESHKNFFGKAFEQAVEKTNANAEIAFFDSNVIRLAVSDRSKFFDALISLLS